MKNMTPRKWTELEGTARIVMNALTSIGDTALEEAQHQYLSTEGLLFDPKKYSSLGGKN